MTGEDFLQKACVRSFCLLYPKYVKLLHHSVNEGKRNFFQQRRIKDMGMVAGWPDLQLAVPKGGYPGLFIELKSHNGVLSRTQKDVIELLRQQGYRVEVVRTLDQFIAVVNEYLHAK